MESPNDFSNDIILVGNGESVLNYDCRIGEIIDSFGIVVRFNGCQDRLIPQSGFKTDIVACNNSEKSYLYLTEDGLVDKDMTYYVRDEREDPDRGRRERAKEFIRFFEENSINYKMIKFETNHLPKSGKEMTNGLGMIYQFLKEFPERQIYIHGFDSVEGIRPEGLHFFEDRRPLKVSVLWGRHNLEEEGEILQEKVRQGVVFLLKDFFKGG